MEVFQKVVILGVGLIGGSFGLAVKEAGAARHIVGVGREQRNLQRAIARGAIDEASHDVSEAARGADLIFVATPVATMQSMFERLVPVLEPEALITDGGSTKQSVIDAARAALGQNISRFIPSHPIAGSEKSGASAADGQLYRGREVIVTPLPENQPADLARIRRLWEQCGARVSEMTPAEHDAALAVVSHLPHFAAFAYMSALAGRAGIHDTLEHAGNGFRDFTRLASSHPQMWCDIFMANKAALLLELDYFEWALAELRIMVESGAAGALEQRFATARAVRDAWVASSDIAQPDEE